MEQNRLISKLFLGLSIIAVLSALLTVIPLGTVSEKNIIGYKSVCSFAPVSTVILLMLANVFSFVRKKLAA